MEITGDKILSMYESIDRKLDDITVQTTATNGRVTRLEEEVNTLKRNSVAAFFSNHRNKCIMVFILLMLLAIPGTRDFALRIIERYL